MIRCVRIWTAKDGNSEFEEGTIDLSKGERGDVLSGNVAASSISFRETKSGGTFATHDAPTRQFVLTLSGALEFKTAKITDIFEEIWSGRRDSNPRPQPWQRVGSSCTRVPCGFSAAQCPVNRSSRHHTPPALPDGIGVGISNSRQREIIMISDG
jgi:hypothetical protein